MKDIPKATRPVKAPARVAPLQKIPNRVWIMCLGYHIERLVYTSMRNGPRDCTERRLSSLVEGTGSEPGLCSSETDADSDKL